MIEPTHLPPYALSVANIHELVAPEMSNYRDSTKTGRGIMVITYGWGSYNPGSIPGVPTEVEGREVSFLPSLQRSTMRFSESLVTDF